MLCTDYVIDIETLSTHYFLAQIPAFAVIGFDRRKGIDQDFQTFFATMQLKPQIERGRVADDSTISFWKKQDPAISEVVFTEEKDPSAALNQMGQWFIDTRISEQCTVWGNDPLFDLGNMEMFLKQYGIKPPWKYWNRRCYRTIVDLLGPAFNVPGNPMKHHPVYDALHEAQTIASLLQKEIVVKK